MRGLVIVCCAVALTACSKSDPPATASSMKPVEAKDSAGSKLRARAVAAAKAAGIAPIKQGSGVAGPFLTDGALAYTDGQGRVSYYEASESALTLALRNPPRVVFKVTPEGAFEMDGGVLEPIAKVPAEAARFPHVEALMARVIAATRARVNEKREARERVVPRPLPARWLSDAPEASAIGEEDCEEHHVDGFNVGCY